MDPLINPLRSVHTTHFPAILNQLGISLVVSTYQAGKLIVVRADGDKLNTHFRIYQKPMGLAVAEQRLAIGCAYQIWELRNVPAVGHRLNPPGKHDACFIPRQTHITGDIDIHEMAYGKEGLWFLNTRFSCLCTVDTEHSFVPRWRPPFVTAYDLTDRCHLNGLALVNGIPRYITALGATNTPGGWRANKANGGILMDVGSNKILLQGLSMPHSPRWYQDRLWVLESGQGSLARVDLHRGTWQAVATVPGFTRGVDFYGPLAFVGLSKVRESAVFSGIPLTQRLTERICGVWVIHIETGETLAFLRFEEGVEEIFSVQVLPGIRFPEVFGDPRFNDPEQEKLIGSTYVLPDEALKQVVNEPVPVFCMDTATTEPEPEVKSFAVVVPIFNKKKNKKKGWPIIEQTLTSIEASTQHFYKNYPFAEQISHEIVIVDDASEGNTWDLLNQWAQQKNRIRLIRHTNHQGQGAARNTGIQATQAQAIFFCDEGNLFLEDHVLTCLKLINRPLDPNLANPIYRLPKSYPAAVKTGIRIQLSLHPYWYDQIKQVLPLNLCIRREAHEFIEGFPADKPFRESNYEDEGKAYIQWLTTFFSVVWTPEQTVEYVHYPGNYLSRQLQKFQSDPRTFQETIPPEQQTYFEQIHQIIAQRQAYLHQKFEQDFNPDRLLALGNEAHVQGEWEKAADYFRRCLQLDPQMKVARYNLGVTCGDLEHWQEAEYHLSLSIQEDPGHPRAHNYLGLIYVKQNRLAEAIQQYEKAIQLDPQFADAHMNLGMAWLKQGELKQGWQEFEWRWQTSQFTPFQCPHPRWQGEDISQQTLLVHTEQGSGDSIQFVRFLPLAAQRCQKLILVCPNPLKTLFQGIPGVSGLYGAGEIPLTAFQVYSPLMSLPWCLGIHSLDQIPNQVPYLQVPEIPSSLRIEKSPSILNVGICWAGSPTQGNDRNRSSHLKQWLPILSVSGIQFHSLQKGPQVKQLADLPSDIQLKNWDPWITDFADTAALISQLDLVISVDTAVAHLAGALAKPTWILLCQNCDWRWLRERQDSPYYPSVRLFRQQQEELGWDPLMPRVSQSLRELSLGSTILV
ncbi:TIGR03032 family protein [Synechococcus sp. Nb3U1]|uniref:TIGR03032 family protein n=1 Tax=Synechococcus sp. Nb3U1 TaxID=1914529 RepID=UPI001F41D665|nr:TIGR03032 family protein [Synechococcus sp. Nb3U1]MCF2970397.1 TIGR03032 family protein [Synechococcus sp. Nb3U1]